MNISVVKRKCLAQCCNFVVLSLSDPGWQRVWSHERLSGVTVPGWPRGIPRRSGHLQLPAGEVQWGEWTLLTHVPRKNPQTVPWPLGHSWEFDPELKSNWIKSHCMHSDDCKQLIRLCLCLNWTPVHSFHFRNGSLNLLSGVGLADRMCKNILK